MGSGTWTACAYNTYTKATYNVSADSIATTNFTTQDFYRSRSLADVLNVKGKIRECLDSDEHPNSYPIILALDVTVQWVQPLPKLEKSWAKLCHLFMRMMQ